MVKKLSIYTDIYDNDDNDNDNDGSKFAVWQENAEMAD